MVKRVVFVMFLLGASGARAEFDVRCSFVSGEEPQPIDICTANFQLCRQTEPASCEDRGVIACPGEQGIERFDGVFTRAQSGNEVTLKGVVAEGELSPFVVMGPARSLPRPGQPVVADSTLDFYGRKSSGSCSVRVIR